MRGATGTRGAALAAVRREGAILAMTGSSSKLDRQALAKERRSILLYNISQNSSGTVVLTRGILGKGMVTYGKLQYAQS